MATAVQQKKDNTAYQLGFIPSVWDPFFGESIAAVLTSHVSKSFPISDAGLGAFAYTFEMLMGWMGMTTRWRTMPWMVTSPWVLEVASGERLSAILGGLAVMALSVPRGPVKEQYGYWKRLTR